MATPIRVHPLIKLARYGFLCSGIVYGYNRRIEFSEIATQEREEWESKKEERRIALEEEKARIEKRDFEMIEEAIFGKIEVEEVVVVEEPPPKKGKKK